MTSQDDQLIIKKIMIKLGGASVKRVTVGASLLLAIILTLSTFAAAATSVALARYVRSSHEGGTER